MTTSMYCVYFGFDYTYIDINALAQGIKSCLASQMWARTYDIDSPAIISNHSATDTSLYVCMYVCMYVYMHVNTLIHGLGFGLTAGLNYTKLYLPKTNCQI